MSAFPYLVAHDPFEGCWNRPLLLGDRHGWLERHCGSAFQRDYEDGLWYQTASNHFRFRHATHALAFARHFGAHSTLGHMLVIPVDNNYRAAAWAHAELGPASQQRWLMQSSVLWFASEPHAIECALRFR